MPTNIVRKIRKDKKPRGVKMTLHLTVKMRPGSRAELKTQATQAGFQSTAQYLRELANRDRARLGMLPYDYNEFEASAPTVGAA